MQQYISRRLLLFIPTAFFATLVIFFLMRVVPGDAVITVIGGAEAASLSQEQLAEIRHNLGLDRPLYIQYLDWLGSLLRGDLGKSLWTGDAVAMEIAARYPITLELALLGSLIALAVAIPAGVVAAIKQDTVTDYILRIFCITGMAMPTFWTGILIIFFLVLFFNWMPPLGVVGVVEDPGKSLQQFIWPALALGGRMLAVLARLQRSTMLEVLREDYIRTAWAKGLRERAIIFRHALKNALLPVITITGIQLGALMGGTVIMESIFTLPGVGRLLIDSINQRDYPVVQTIVVMLAFIFASVNLIVDLAYAWLNPRIRYS